MKKTTLFFAILIFSVCFASCSKEEESLSGTTWEGNVRYGLASLKFTSETQCRIVSPNYDSADDTMLYSYKLDYPNVTMTPLNESPYHVTLEGVITGNVMQVINPTITSGNQVIYTLTKQ